MAKFFKKCFFFVLLTILTTSVLGQKEITILYFSDVSGQLMPYEKQDSYSSIAPVPCDSASNTSCTGGLPQIVQLILNSIPDPSKTIKLAGGNLVGGENGWISVIQDGNSTGWEEYGKILATYYKPDAAALGMKEFGAGESRTIDYMTGALSSFILSNCDSCNSFEPHVDKFKVISKDSLAIGVVGFVNPDVTKLSSPGAATFKNVVQGLQEGITEAKNANGDIKLFIAIGEGNLDMAKEIIDSVPDIKLVLFSRSLGRQSGESFIKYGNGFIGTAGIYGSTLEKLTAKFDANGSLTDITGVTLDVANIPIADDSAKAAITLVNEFRDQVKEIEAKILTKSVARLQGGSICWKNQCNLGNLITDSMVDCAYVHFTGEEQTHTPLIAIWHSGSLFNDDVEALKEINEMDVHRWLPYHNNVFYSEITGQNLWNLFELAITGIDPPSFSQPNWGQFFQVSNGVEISILFPNSTSSNKYEIESIRVAHHDEDSVPILKDLEMESTYKVILPSFIFEGRNIFNGTGSYWQNRKRIDFDDTCVINYLKRFNILSTGLEERIKFVSKTVIPNCPEPEDNDGGGTSTATTVTLTIVFFVMIMGLMYIGFAYVIPVLTGRPANWIPFRRFD